MSERFVESVARTKKLHCSGCLTPIRVGEEVVFKLDDCEKKPMKDVYCHKCKKDFEMEVLEDQRHPLDLDDGYYTGGD